MASYRWRIPQLKAVQFDGTNHAEVKDFLNDDTPGEEFTIGTGKFEQPPEDAPPGTPPKEIREPIEVSEGDWVTLDLATNKYVVNPEGFPDQYEYLG